MDPVLFEILSNKVTAIADEMRITMQRTSRSVFVNEASDFAVGLIDLEGEVFAWPPGSKTTSINVPAAYTISAVEVEPGDVIISNDPYLSQGMATHLPDLHLIRPYYHEGRVVAYGWGFIHYMDIGGRVPGSMTIENTEIFQEGIRIPPMKIVKGGELNADFVKIFQANCRLPDINMADIRSTLGCLEVGAKRVAETIALYGADTFIECQSVSKDYSAAKARAVLRRLPDGVYDFWDYIDDDLVSDIPIRMRLRMTVADGTLHFDLTGTDPQVPAAYNVPTAGILHNWLTRRITTFIRTHDDTIPLNAGMYRHITATNPPGTVLNAEFPDPVAERHATATSFNNAVSGALLKAAPDLMAGPTCGTGGIIVYTEPGGRGRDRERHHRSVLARRHERLCGRRRSGRARRDHEHHAQPPDRDHRRQVCAARDRIRHRHRFGRAGALARRRRPEHDHRGASRRMHPPGARSRPAALPLVGRDGRQTRLAPALRAQPREAR